MAIIEKRRSSKEISELKSQIKHLKLDGVRPMEIMARLNLSKPLYYFHERNIRGEVKTELASWDNLRLIQPLKEIRLDLNPVQFCDEYLPIKPKFMQRLMLKAFYNLELSEDEKLRLWQLKREGKTTWEEGGDYKELVLLIGMKGGKTTLAALIVQIEEYLLYKIGDICKHYGFIPGEEIYIINVATNAEQARTTIFAKTKASMERSPYFKTRRPRAIGDAYHFKDTNVIMLSGHSNSASLVGKTCKLVLFDELDRFVSTRSGKYSAEEVYEALSKSTDPFGKEGHRVCISSLVHSKGFMVKQYELCKQIKSMLGFWMSEWEMQPDRYTGKTFNFRGIDIPVEHKDDFDKNAGKFLRDKASMIGYSTGKYYTMPDRVRDIFKTSQNEGYRNPLDEQGRFQDWFKPLPGVRYYMHLDPSSNHDAFAIALGHKTKTGKTAIDLIHRILPKVSGQEIEIEEVVKFMQDLFRRIPNIELISYDTWAARAITQVCERCGYKVETLFIKIQQQDSLKEEIYTNRFRCYIDEVLENELLELELDGDKVDHPIGGSKDSADAVSGVVWHCTRDSGIEASLITSADASQRAGFDKLRYKRRRSIWDSYLQ